VMERVRTWLSSHALRVFAWMHSDAFDEDAYWYPDDETITVLDGEESEGYYHAYFLLMPSFLAVTITLLTSFILVLGSVGTPLYETVRLLAVLYSACGVMTAGGIIEREDDLDVVVEHTTASAEDEGEDVERECEQERERVRQTAGDTR